MNGFLGSAILEKAIGVAFVYLLLAIFCTASVEWIAGLLATRANTLRDAISRLLSGQMLPDNLSFLSAFFAHPLIAPLTKDEEHPAWLSARAFSTVVLHLALRPCPESTLLTLPANLPKGEVRTVLESLLRHGQADFSHLQTGLENWFDDAMRRASFSYQKQARTWTFILAVAITVTTNADTLQLLQHTGPLPGWSQEALHLNLFGWLARLTGWVLTVGAVSLGAPFWFEVLNRFVNFSDIRRSQQASQKPAYQSPESRV